MVYLSIVSLNVGGLFSKLDLGILDIKLKNYDIVCLLETKTNLPIFKNTYFSNFEKIVLSNNSKGNFGGTHGICILIKPNLFKYVTELKGKSDSVLWLKIDEKAFGFEFIIGAVYIACDGSKFFNEDAF